MQCKRKYIIWIQWIVKFPEKSFKFGYLLPFKCWTELSWPTECCSILTPSKWPASHLSIVQLNEYSILHCLLPIHRFLKLKIFPKVFQNINFQLFSNCEKLIFKINNVLWTQSNLVSSMHPPPRRLGWQIYARNWTDREGLVEKCRLSAWVQSRVNGKL